MLLKIIGVLPLLSTNDATPPTTLTLMGVLVWSVCVWTSI